MDTNSRQDEEKEKEEEEEEEEEDGLEAETEETSDNNVNDYEIAIELHGNFYWSQDGEKKKGRKSSPLLQNQRKYGKDVHAKKMISKGEESSATTTTTGRIIHPRSVSLSFDSSSSSSPSSSLPSTLSSSSSSSSSSSLQTPALSVPTPLRIRAGSLVGVVGQVGAGKTNLIVGALLGHAGRGEGAISRMNVAYERRKRRRTTTVEGGGKKGGGEREGRRRGKGGIVYVSQSPWVFNATLKENVLFGRPFHPRRYESTIKMCALRSDILQLPAGDQTGG